MPEQIDVLRDTIQGELKGFAKSASKVWHEVSRKPIEPSPQQKFSDFMGMGPQERQLMLQEMGPEKYMEHVDSMINIGHDVIGPGAEGLRQYFEQDVQLQQQQVPDHQAVETYDPSALDSLLEEHLGQIHGGSTGP